LKIPKGQSEGKDSFEMTRMAITKYRMAITKYRRTTPF